MSNINKKNKELNNLIDQYITVYNTIPINKKHLSNTLENYLKYNKEINFIKKFKMNYYTFILGKFILDLYNKISYLLNTDLKIKKDFDINILSVLLKLSISIIDLLINLGADINMIYYDRQSITDIKTYTILLVAIKIFYKSSYITTDFKELVYYLINKNIDLNINLKYSEIVRNIHNVNPEIFVMRTPINQVLYEIDSIIFWRSHNKNLKLSKIEIFTEFIKLFIENGENINYIDNSNKSSLILSIPLNLFKIVEILVNAGINIDAVDKDGNTALMISIKYQNEEIILFLIEKGTNLKLINKDKKSTLDLAKEYSNKNIISAIEKKLVNNFNNIFRNINSNKDNFNINVNDLVFITNGKYFGYIFKIIEIKENKKYDVLFIFHNINIISSHNIIINNKINNKNTNFLNISNKTNLTNSIGYIIDGSDKGCLIKIDDIINDIYNVSYIKINNKIIKNIKCLNNISIDNVIYK